MRSTFLLLIVLIGIIDFLVSCTSSRSNEVNMGYSLVWHDEFDYTGYPDSTKWDYDVGNGCPDLCGWGNDELQYYTRKSLSNARVADGMLTIEVQKEEIEKHGYSSARLVTRGRQDWQYGRFEIRAKLPESMGVWSAIWMLPSDTTIYGRWPKCGEVDIMENVGFDPDTIMASVHSGSFNLTKGALKNQRHALLGNDEQFHNYILEWNEDKIEVSVDEHPYFSFKNSGNGYMEWPFDQPMYLLMNVAYGGNWGAQGGLEPEKLPQKMQIDYVRVYQMNR